MKPFHLSINVGVNSKPSSFKYMQFPIVYLICLALITLPIDANIMPILLQTTNQSGFFYIALLSFVV